MNLKLVIREMEKAALQYILLPAVYSFYRNQQIDNTLAIIADSKSDGTPFSLQAMEKRLKLSGYTVMNCCDDYSKLSVFRKLRKSVAFMKLYSRAKYVFICDYYLPVSSCRKKNETKVVQLWHASGLQKKFGYDAVDDLGGLYFVRPTKNFDLVPVSAECMREVIANNWRLFPDTVQALGTSRSDTFFEEDYLESCKDRFYKIYPEAVGKKIILWAPSFRGNGSFAEIQGIEEILAMQERLSDRYFFIIKLHPHLQEKYQMDNCEMPTEELYPVVDILITDYSSVFYDYLLFNDNVIFYVPDYAAYKNTRGLYIDYEKEFSYPIVDNTDDLFNEISQYKFIDKQITGKYKDKFIARNDGKASERIIEYLENSQKV